MDTRDDVRRGSNSFRNDLTFDFLKVAMDENKYRLLHKINDPNDIKNLSINELPALCNEIRQYIIEVICKHPGHLGASLGTVEITVAIHYVFDTPYDNVVWDVGHQSYAHKILTGRKDKFDTIRQLGGLSGFPKISESEYDAFGVGHASTSVSAALGMAIAAQQNQESERNTIAIVGDGATTGGMIYEALNHTGSTKANMIVILNDNGIAIDESTGALKDYLLDLALSTNYNKIKEKLYSKLVEQGSNFNRDIIIQQIKRGMKSTCLSKSNLFESLGVRYFGPSNGHDVIQLVEILRQMKKIKGPKLFHCITVKGKGLTEAEKNQTKYHAPGIFDPGSGKTIQDDNSPYPKFQDVFGKTIVKLAESNKKIIGITPAMLSGSSLDIMMKQIPDRCFDVGIAEEHAVTFAAGLVAKGMQPYLAIYSTFLQRGYDQVIHDVALQQLPVVFCIDRAGLVGDDGPTHHGAFDLAFLRSIPNVIISAPMDEIQLQNLMYTAQFTKLPFAIRYPRGRGITADWELENYSTMEIGKGRRVIEGKDIAIVTIGKPGTFVNKAMEILQSRNQNITPSHYDMIFLKPLDIDLMNEICSKHKHIITVEDGTIIGGLGSAVIEFVAENGYSCKVKRLGIPDAFIEHGNPNELYRICGFNAEAIADAVTTCCS